MGLGQPKMCIPPGQILGTPLPEAVVFDKCFCNVKKLHDIEQISNNSGLWFPVEPEVVALIVFFLFKKLHDVE